MPLPATYEKIRKTYPKYAEALNDLGVAAKGAGPLSEATAQLVQLAAAAAVHSEGAVHSHARRALAAGVTPAEVRHAILLLTSTIGFQTVSAALTWVEDVMKGKGR